jgi:hypothetical protein
MDPKGKPPHDEKFLARDVPLGKGLLTQGKLKPPDVLFPPV